jgi:acyl-CoA thioester hydrolase
MEIDFLRPASIDDVLSITTSSTAVGGARIHLLQQITRAAVRLLEAKVSVVLIGANGRPSRLPEAIRSAFRPPAAS